MRVFYHSAFLSQELTGNSAVLAVPCESRLELRKTRGDSESEVYINGELTSSDIVPVYLDKEIRLTIQRKNEKVSYTVKPLVNTLADEQARIYEQFAHEYIGKLTNEIESIRADALRMYAVEYATRIRDWSGTFDQLQEAFRAFKSIGDRPRSHLKAINEVRPIETVKRIGYESIAYLAAHSEDWLARTATGLKPARLFSRVEEDDYQIYENRVVKTLIDEIIIFLRRTEQDLKSKRGQLQGIIDSNVQVGSFGFDVLFQKAVHELLVSDPTGDDGRDRELKLAKELEVRARKLLREYLTLRDTKLYRHLKKVKRITDTLHDTNILLMDKHYNVIYELWKSVRPQIRSKRVPERVSNDDGPSFASALSGYITFCKVLCGYTANVLNFRIEEDGRYFRKEDNLEISIREEDGIIHVVMRDKAPYRLELPRSVSVPIEAGESHGAFHYNGKELFWDPDVSADETDEFCALLKPKDSSGRARSEGTRRYHALKGAIEKYLREIGTPPKTEFIIAPTVVSVDSTTRSTFRKYTEEHATALADRKDVQHVIVALPKCDEDEQTIISYARDVGERVLILPLSMFDINSFRRLQNVFLRYIVAMGTEKCPCCAGTMREKDNQLICDDCSQLVLTKTVCPNRECRHEYHYLSYELTEDTIHRMKKVTEQDFFHWDSLYQYKNIVDMSVDSGRLRTVCPACGQI